MNILEINQNISGRRKIKIVLHEIYPNTSEWNENGITWLEQYTRDNADTIKGMPLCAEFVDNDKDIPYGHGLTGIKGNIPVFEDSVQVGAFEDWSIEDLEIDGKIHKCLCGTGYINENRYPNFCAWIDKQIAENNKIFGSVETTGTPENSGEIIYQDGWKEKGRIPMIYDYSGYCIVTIKPADDTAMLLEFDKAKQERNETPENEFDSIFGGVERNTAQDRGFDDVFLATIGTMYGDKEPEKYDDFDDVFENGFHGKSVTKIEDMIDVFE